MQGTLRWAVIAALSFAVACDGESLPPDGGDPLQDGGPRDGGPRDAARDASREPECNGPPGLYRDGSCTELAPGVRPFQPRYVLWSDGADKERFIYLPDGAQIDVTAPEASADHWVFPIGTRIYKTFSIGGVRLETRLLEKRRAGAGPDAWDMFSYAWNAEQDDATREVAVALRAEDDNPLRRNVLGTTHDIPDENDCITCHRGAVDTVNGFSAIQLNHDLGGVTLQTLLTEDRLNAPIDLAAARVPGNAVEQEALGYLHSNCGNCHRRGVRDMPGVAGFEMWVNVGATSVAETPTYRTGVGVTSGGRCIIAAGAPAQSYALTRMNVRGVVNGVSQMPPIGSEQTHAAGIETVSAWIRALPTGGGSCP